MKKSELKNGMIVKTSGGRYGVVCLKDATNENCIKFLYDPNYLLDYGCLLNSGCMLESLDNLDDNLNFYYHTTKEDHLMDIKIGDKLIVGQIIEVFDLNQLWLRNNLHPTPNGLYGDVE